MTTKRSDLGIALVVRKESKGSVAKEATIVRGPV